MAQPRHRFARAAMASALGVGLALRLYQLSTVRSLWLDEAMLAINIVERSYGGLLTPLEYNQAAPVLFLWLQHAATQLFGAADIVLRLVPLLAACAAGLLLARVAWVWLGGFGALSVALFALSTPLVDYSTEVKQYSTDMLATAALLWAALPWTHGEPSVADARRLGIVGVVAPWLSHPALLVLTGVGLAVALGLRAATGAVRRSSAAALAASGVSGALVVWVLRGLTENAALQQYWASSYWPWNQPQALSWLGVTASSVLRDGAGLRPEALVGAIAVLGVVYLMRQRPAAAVVSVMPIAAALVASALHVYPIAPRLMLFAVPCVFLLVAAGASAVVAAARRIDGRVAVAIAAALSATILFRPAEGAVQRVLNPRRSEHIRPLLDHLLEQWREGDSLYVYYGAKPAVRFYGRTYNLPHAATMQGRASRDRPRGYLEQIDAMNAGGRLWVLLSHNCPSCRVDEYAYIVDGVSKRRNLEDSRRSYGSALHLFAPAEAR